MSKLTITLNPNDGRPPFKNVEHQLESTPYKQGDSWFISVSRHPTIDMKYYQGEATVTIQSQEYGIDITDGNLVHVSGSTGETFDMEIYS